MSDYKTTLCLPKTDFPMKANLKQKEPETLAFWEKEDVYARMVAANEGRERYVLHDGPPYANGHIHMGTAMNKVLKDIIVKSRNMMGLKAEYVPGWDCHGLPIEHKVAQELKEKGKTDVPPLTVRRICRDYARKWLDTQRKEFKRLGVFGVWDKPYMTMDPLYESTTARELGNFAKTGSLVRGKKPIYWCLDCETALAEAEVEYGDHTSPSIFVRFPMPDPRLAEVFPGADPKNAYVVIWTTTPWTLPGNMAVAAHPEFDYVLVEAAGGQYVLAKALLESCAAIFGWKDYRVLGETTGKALEGLKARHPFIDRESALVLADYVTLEQGSGLVHTAPGHGREDYETGVRYGLEVLSPLDDKGRFLPVVEHFAGMTVFEANPKVIELLKSLGHLLAQKSIAHSYPHCWRCKQPVIFRATTQWFISMEKNDLRKKALTEIMNSVRWIPSWGRERIYSMIENRPDWCISRQRNWGVPIVALICKDCDTAYTDPEWIYSVVDRFATHERGCDYWFEAPLEEVVPAGLTCPHCGGAHWEKEDDILDVWFDSGTSFAAVVEKREECRYPADLYLEGTDQHRGWFHSSLLASVGTRGQAPYKSVLTHGYVVDGDGRKMSKSLGNVIAPQEIIDKNGAEILRMWVSAVNYQDDVRISDDILSRLVDGYRRVRNTCRFLLGNLADFAPDAAVPFKDMLPLDRYAMDMVARAHDRIREAYESFQFHKVFHTLLDLCVSDLSAFYLDITKDRLYTAGKDSLARRSAQTVLWRTLSMLMCDMAPILSFTAEEVFRHLPEALKPGGITVFEQRFEMDAAERMDADERARFESFIALREEVNRAIEPLRKAGDIGHSLDTAVTLHVPSATAEALAASGLDLREFLIVSEAAVSDAPAPEGTFRSPEAPEGVSVTVAKASGEKCERCWTYSTELGTNPEHPHICPRCTGVLR
ncbi:Isoleucyl-tRNA synthetase [Desulfovibrio sp. X2]|uniref:isoleucine--tRNA ligase n=1 Tax=Desulfovibrio sp. X2 TaxID=941449 RepID=UPI000358DCEB|nr:isoleucine--tRNA ligase [Desulfovibrio sp. X2]EPR42263.1 Isoleucyl-tRNA synthetase [Desulfovibrio sp. X2]